MIDLESVSCSAYTSNLGQYHPQMEDLPVILGQDLAVSGICAPELYRHQRCKSMEQLHHHIYAIGVLL